MSAELEERVKRLERENAVMDKALTRLLTAGACWDRVARHAAGCMWGRHASDCSKHIAQVALDELKGLR